MFDQAVGMYFKRFYEGLYLFQKTGVNTARTLYVEERVGVDSASFWNSTASRK